MTVNHVNMLPPYAVQVGPTVVGADIDMTKLIGKVTFFNFEAKLQISPTETWYWHQLQTCNDICCSFRRGI